ncbi:MAG: hypothetical protein FWG36_10835 [Oscillospiraceae bacterium]|nr:hypothetical protein [Oscillospiraceae bacterium]
MICEKCGSNDFVCISMPDNRNTTIVISAGKEIARESIGETPEKISVCKKCGSVTVEGDRKNS